MARLETIVNKFGQPPSLSGGTKCRGNKTKQKKHTTHTQENVAFKRHAYIILMRKRN